MLISRCSHEPRHANYEILQTARSTLVDQRSAEAGLGERVAHGRQRVDRGQRALRQRQLRKHDRHGEQHHQVLHAAGQRCQPAARSHTQGVCQVAKHHTG